LHVIGLPLRDLGACRFHLGLQSAGPLLHLGHKSFDSLQQRRGRTVAFFEGGHASGALRGVFSGGVALAAQSGEAIVPGCELGFELGARLFDGGQFRLPRCDQAFLLFPFCR